MRLAELATIREALVRRHAGAAPQINALAFSQVPGFPDSSVNPSTGYLAICGGTGVGKSMLLELIYTALKTPDDLPPRGIEKLVGARVSIDVKAPECDYTLCDQIVGTEGIPTALGYSRGAFFAGVEQRTFEIQSLLRKLDIQILREGVDPSSFDKETIAALSLICRKDYRDVTYHDVEIAPDVVVPLFSILTPSFTYDSRMMSSGELSAFYLAWLALRAEPFAILLIEEPESFLPPASHGPMIGLVSRFAISKHLGIVITTHSPSIAAELPDSNLLSIRRVRETSHLPTTSEAKERVLHRLGLVPSRKAVLFVEDEIAGMVLSEILGIAKVDEVISTETVIGKDGSSGIKEMLKRIPRGIRTCKFVGVLDGDMKIQASQWDVGHPLAFLPLEKAIEGELIGVIEKNPKSFSLALNRNEDDVLDALDAITRADQHDRIRAMSSILHVPLNALVAASMRLKKRSNRKALEAFAKQLLETA